MNDGRASNTCNSVVYSGLPISDASVSRLIALKSDVGDHEIVRDTAMIPTAPSYSGDLVFTDLQKLMDDQRVFFQLPVNNALWLLKHEWIS